MIPRPFIRAAPVLCLLAGGLDSTYAADPLGLLEKHCVECHSGAAPNHNFDLTTREGLLRGGEAGPAIVPGQPQESELIKRITHSVKPGMPYKKEKLSAAEIQ